MDKDYWRRYYRDNATKEPSDFAWFINNEYGVRDKTIIELGCGDGRDALFFCKMGARVLAVDQVDAGIKNRIDNGIDGLTFIESDFTSLPEQEGEFDIVYSRFTLHSVSKEQQDRTLKWGASALKSDGIFCLEFRGKLNNLYKKGCPVYGEDDAFIYDNHYRRFIDREEVAIRLSNLGLRNIVSVESQGFARTATEDSFFVRNISKKL